MVKPNTSPHNWTVISVCTFWSINILQPKMTVLIELPNLKRSLQALQVIASP